MPLSESIEGALVKFRKNLHKHPELSGFESATSRAIIDFITPTNPTKLIPNIGGYGIAAIYDSGLAGPTVLFRADIDALPIQESNSFHYCSVNKGVAHLCGHDGHSAILAGLSYCLMQKPPRVGKVVLLFQPAEETGQGAARVISDEKFNEIKPDYAFALHNLPGFERGAIFVKNDSFASASTGMVMELKGLSSHAAHPEDGNNPDRALAQIIIGLNELVPNHSGFKDFTLLTVIHAKLGEVAFGTTPGNAVVMATLRAYRDSDMAILKNLAEQLVADICLKYNIKYEISYKEEFPATVNHSFCVDLVKKAGLDLGISVFDLNAPFKWSEDFGHFSQIINTGFFGVGSGINHSQLHNEDYDFPDVIIAPSVQVFERILGQLFSNHK